MSVGHHLGEVLAGFLAMSAKFDKTVLWSFLRYKLAEAIVLISVVLSAFLVTFQVFYNASLEWQWIVIYSCDAIYLSSLVSKFCKGYYDKRGEKVTDWSETAEKYLRTYFVIDIISILPLESFGLLVEEPNIRLFIMAFLRINRFIRIYRVWHFLSKC